MGLDAEQEVVDYGPLPDDPSLMVLAGGSMFYDQVNGKIYIDGEQMGPGVYYLWDGVWANLLPDRNLVVTSHNSRWTAASHRDSFPG